MMSQANLTKNNMTNLDLNPGHLVCLVHDWVVFYGTGLNLGVTIYSDESCDGDGVSLAVP